MVDIHIESSSIRTRLLAVWPAVRGAVRGTLRVDALVLALAILAGLTAAFWQYTQDDVFITYAYSRNLAEGQGFVFNPGQPVQGTTTPLHTLLMAAVYRLTPDLLHAGNLISAACLAGVAYLLARLLRPYLSPYAEAGLLLLIASAPIAYVSFGMETLAYSLILILACLLWATDHRRAAILAAAMLTWLRADGIVLGGTLGLLALGGGIAAARRGDRPWWGAAPWDLAALYALGIAPWFGFAWAYFGSPLPNTFAAKQAMFGGLLWWTDGAGWWTSFYGNNPLSLLALPLIGVGLWRTWRIPRLRPLAVWPVLYASGYTVLNVTAFWYYTPLVLVLIGLAALGGQTLAPALIGRGAPRRVLIAAVGGGVLLSTVLGIVQALVYAPPPPRVATYTLAGEWIAAHTDPAETLLVADLGIAGYHARRPTLDTFGLIVPDMQVRSPEYAILKYRPDLVLATRYFFWEATVHAAWFEALYAPLVAFSTPGDAGFSPMTVYRRRYPLRPPDQIVAGGVLPLTCRVGLDESALPEGGIAARLAGPEGQPLVADARLPLDGLDPALARPADHLLDQFLLPINVPPGTYGWALDCGATRPEPFLAGTVEVIPIEAAPGYVALADPVWDGRARLRGIVLPEGVDVWSGGALPIGLDWEALRSFPEDYSVFLHLVDGDGILRAQRDGYPANGGRPTTTWQPGERLLDERLIVLPPDLPEGDYRLLVGLYDWRNDLRLPLDGRADSRAYALPVTVHNHWPGGSGLP